MEQDFLNILIDLIKIPSPSCQEQELANYIVNTYGGGDWMAEKDELHNIYFRRQNDDETPKLPLLIAHLDTHPNGDIPENNIRLREADIISLENGHVLKKYEIQMGFDDKAGVASILYLMKNTSLEFRVLFVTQEESANRSTQYERGGGGGIDFALEHSFQTIFNKTSFVFTLDRMNGNEIIDEYGIIGNLDRPKIRLCSEEFRDWIINCGANMGYPMNVAVGSIADAYNIRSKHPDLNCVNLSIGFRDEHTAVESLEIDETIAIIKLVQECLS